MKQLFTLFAILISMVANAQTVNVEDARAKASSLFRSNVAFAKGQSASAKPELTYTSQTADAVCFYVFNNPQGGFAIIGGDATAREVLGYSSNGTFDINDIPEGMRDMLNAYQKQIAAGAKMSSGNVTNITMSVSKTNIDDMIKTKWGQNDPYNRAIPTLGSNYAKFVTGCNAIAAAQIMRYHNWAKGSGSHSYTINYNGTMPLQFSADFGNTDYDLSESLMPVNFNGSYNNDQVRAVSTLIYHLGVAMDMNYGDTGSSSSSTAPGKALAENFGYDKGLRLLHRDYYEEEEWEDIIYSELAAGRPVLYSGDDTALGGHAFVVHGYKDGMYAVNWGWNGAGDGYFALNGSNALNSKINGQFNVQQGAMINIKPDKTGTSTYSCDISAYQGVKLSETRYQSNAVSNISLNKTQGDKDLYLFAQIYNSGVFAANFDYGVAFRNKVTGKTFFTSKRGSLNLNRSVYTGYQSISFSTEAILENGEYEVTPSFRPSGAGNDAWQIMRADRNTNIPTITVTGATSGEKIDLSFDLSKTTLKVDDEISINVSSAYDGTLTFTSDNPSVATVDGDGTITAIAPGTARITVSATETEYFKAGSKSFDIIVVEKPAAPEDYNDYLVVTETLNEPSKKIVKVQNTGDDGIYISKITMKVKPEYNMSMTFDTNFSLYSGYAVSFTLTYPKSVDQVAYEIFYTYNGKECVYYTDVNDPDHPDYKPTLVGSITLSDDAKTMRVGDNFSLTATVAPDNAKNKTVAWTSSNQSVATVDAQGNVTAVGVGTAVITAKATDGSDVSSSCTVTVEKTPVSGITISSLSKTMKEGETFTLSATVSPDNATDKSVEWTSSNTSVATVDASGLVTAVSEGEATITVKALDGSNVTASCIVTVEKILVTSIDISAQTKTMKEGETFTLTATVSPDNAKNKAVEWTSSNASVATVDASGLVTAVSEGETTITVKALDGSNATASCVITVIAVHVENIILSEQTKTMKQGETFTLTATVTPDNAKDKSLVWSSSDVNVATVDANGNVTAVAPGNAVITATAHDGNQIAGSCDVTVNPDNSQLITETQNLMSGVKTEYDAATRLSNEIDKYLVGTIRSEQMIIFEREILKDILAAYEAYTIKVNGFIEALNNNHVATAEEISAIKTLSMAFSAEALLDSFKENIRKISVKAEGNGMIQFCGETVRNETKEFAFYDPKVEEEIDKLCSLMGIDYHFSVDTFNEIAKILQDDDACCFEIKDFFTSPETYNSNADINITDSKNITVVFHDYGTGIHNATVVQGQTSVYNTAGQKLSQMKKGLNLIVGENGKTMKVLRK